jgi:phage baseplate assembly protein W
MAIINFKSVGKTREQKKTNELKKAAIPIGIATPLRPGSDDLFAMHYNLADQVADNLRNLILTNWGERVGLYNFGGNLRPILSDFVSQDDFDAKATERILSAVNKWMPYVVLETFESSIDRVQNNSSNGTAVVKMTIVYSVPSLQVTRRALEVTMYAM